MRNVRLIDCPLALDHRDNREDQRNRETNGERADDGAQPLSGGVSTPRDVFRLLAGWSLRVPLMSRKPPLGGAQVFTADQIAAVAPRVEPFSRATGQSCVLVAPLEVDLEGLDQPSHCGHRVILGAHEHSIRVRQGCRQEFVGHIAMDERNDQLVEGDRLVELVATCLQLNRRRTDYKDQGFTSLNPSLYSLPPTGTAKNVSVYPNLMIA